MSELTQLELSEPKDEDNIDCHQQQVGVGSLICRGTQQTGRENLTNKVTPAICYSCFVGKIYREVGCDAPSCIISIRYYSNLPHATLSDIFCKIRRRYTTLEYCRSCTLVTSEGTRQIVTIARGLFQNTKFYAAYQDLEKARLAIRDGEFERSITHSIACLESTCRMIHEELGEKTTFRKISIGFMEINSKDFRS